MLTDSLYHCSQLFCLAGALCLAVTLLLTGNSKINRLSWLKRVKQGTAIVFLLMGLSTVLQWGLEQSETRPIIHLALNITIICVATILMNAVLVQQVSASRPASSRNIITLLILALCITIAWIATQLPHNLSQMAIIASIALYIIELVRFIIAFTYNYQTLRLQDREHDIEEEMHLRCLSIIARSLIPLALFAVGYVLCVMLPLQLRAIYNVLLVMMLIYLFVSIINFIINYNNTLINKQIQLSEQDRNNRLAHNVHSELAPLINQWIREGKYRKPGVTMVKLAEELSTNRNYLSQYINIEYGCNFNTWLTGLRIDEAKQLMLSSPTLPIDKVATRVGFSTKAHFMAAFKTREGTTPGQWRKKNTR